MLKKLDMNLDVEIVCPDHGSFFCTPNNHLGYNTDLLAYGCPHCEDVKPVVITEDNISDYYYFISDEDLVNYCDIIEPILIDRKKQIIDKLNLTNDDFVRFKNLKMVTMNL